MCLWVFRFALKFSIVFWQMICRCGSSLRISMASKFEFHGLLLCCLAISEKMAFWGKLKLHPPKHGLRLQLPVYLWLSFLLIGADCNKTHPAEVNALRSIKESLIDPFRNLRYWNRGDPCASNWEGIICYNTSLEDGYFHVQELMLLDRNLSGTLSPEIGRLSHLEIIDFMWNKISGTIPKEIGSISTLRLLLLNGNQLTGPLPEELGNLSNLDRIQIDENEISGPIPKSFANLTSAKHFHMNNNSLSGQIPPELSQLPRLVHLLLDNNNLSGYLPPELSELKGLVVLQLDNNYFTGRIPWSYGNMSLLVKLSLRNCNLEGPILDWSNMSALAYVDLSRNSLRGFIPTGALSKRITTIDLSDNNLSGTIPSSFAELPHLQKLSLARNSLTGSIPSGIWKNRTLNESEKLILDFEDNMFSDIDSSLAIPHNVSIGFKGNPLCSDNLIQLCGPHDDEFSNVMNDTIISECPQNSCPPSYEYAPASPVSQCLCAAPLYVGYRMKSPSFSDFLPYINDFMKLLSDGLGLHLYQIVLDSATWEKGPRLRMHITFFPDVNQTVRKFNQSEIMRIRGLFSRWNFHGNELFGPFELLKFTLPEPYDDEFSPHSSSGVISTGALIGIILGSVAVSLLVAFLVFRWRIRKLHRQHSKSRPSSRIPIKIDGVRNFTFAEMVLATDNFNQRSQVGRGGYGRVYKGYLADGIVVAIKRAQEGSLQGEKEFLTEIELLSRLHHRNLVALVGYCDEEGEQMLVYEFMPNGTLRDRLSGDFKDPLPFSMRVRIALGAARGILYLHTEADPPIFHRDIKATNILLDSKYTAKVADFGLSRLAPTLELDGSEPNQVSTVVKGTPGYLDPEYFLTHKLTDRSDVYSLGVVFMELLTGLQPIFHGKNLVREVNTAYSSGIILSIIDSSMGSYQPECVEKFASLALDCCQEKTSSRPSMAKVVRELENILHMMPESDPNIAAVSSSAGKPWKEVNQPSSSDHLQTPYGAVSLQSPSTILPTPYVSEDISGNDLVSGVFRPLDPR